MARTIEDVDDIVRSVGQMRRIQPADYKTVRVEEYDTAKYGRAGTFMWDPEMKAPSPETDALYRSLIASYGIGEPNEGAWALMRDIEPEGDDLVIARPSSGLVRPFAPFEHTSTIACIDDAVQYVSVQGGGSVSIPHRLTYDPTAIAQAAGVSLTTPSADRVREAAADITTDGPGLYVLDSADGRREVTLATADEKPGLTVTIKRLGRFEVSIVTGTDATIEGEASAVLPDDKTALTLRYVLSSDNWVVV